MSTIAQNVAEIIANLRKDKGWTQMDMARELGISESYLAKVEIGERKPSREFLIKLKAKFPMCDMNIFFAPKPHEACS